MYYVRLPVVLVFSEEDKVDREQAIGQIKELVHRHMYGIPHLTDFEIDPENKVETMDAE